MPKARTAKHAITTILVPTDFSEYSRQALSYAEMVAKTFDAKIVLIHVIDTVSYAVTESIQWTEVYARLEATVQPMLDGLIRDAEKRGVAAESKLTQGVPYDQIVKTPGKHALGTSVSGGAQSSAPLHGCDSGHFLQGRGT
jgi:nucleotide-binding universal stress UspA family protein